MNENITDDPAIIEQDIRRTQDDMSRTVDKIGDQLTPKKIFNALLDKADESGVDTEYLIDGARRNPLALGLIAVGAIWLVSDKDSKIPSLPHRKAKGSSDDFDELDLTGSDIHHRDYVSHMSAFEMRDNEDDSSFQRRRDLHRANFLMCERNPDEDDHSFRQRLNDMTDAFRDKRRAWSDSASETATATKRRTQQLASQASTKAQDLYGNNPLVSGILAAAVGAALGSTIPVSRTEQEQLGGIGSKARDLAAEQKDELTAMAMEKKDELLDKADAALQPESQRQPEPAFQTSGATEEFGGNETRPATETPFIIPDRNV